MFELNPDVVTLSKIINRSNVYVSIDVSTDENNSDHRIFGKVYSVQEDIGKDITILADFESDNYSKNLINENIALKKEIKELKQMMKIGIAGLELAAKILR